MLYWVARALIRLWAKVFLRWRIEGLEHVPRTGPVLLAVNHLSAVDPLLAGTAIRRKVHFMAKEELFRSPALGRLLRHLAAFPVRRGEGDRQALKQALALLEAGEVVGIFPEGTRSPDGQLQQAQTGIAFLAKRGGAAVIPMAVSGTREILRQGVWFPRPARVRILIGEPLHAVGEGTGQPGESDRGEAAHDQLRRFADEVMQKIGELVNRP